MRVLLFLPTLSVELIEVVESRKPSLLTIDRRRIDRLSSLDMTHLYYSVLDKSILAGSRERRELDSPIPRNLNFR